MKKIRFLFTGNFELNGRDRHFTKGEIADAEDNDADRLIAGLCAEEYNGDAEKELIEMPIAVKRKPKKAGE